jgi:RND superfamily putative drug exporter
LGIGDRLATVEEPRTLDVTQSEEPEAEKPSRLYRWGLAVALHRRAVLAACVSVLLLCAISYPSLQKALGPPGYKVNNSQSARVEALLEQRFPGLGSEDDALVFYSSRRLTSDRVYKTVIAAVDHAALSQKGVRKVVGPYDYEAVGQLAPDEHTAVTAVLLGGSTDQRFNDARAIQRAVVRATGHQGVQAWLTGSSPIASDTSDLQKENSKRAESIGLPVALLVLLLAMGAVVAALLPILLAIAGLILADGMLAVLTIFFHFDSLLLAIVSMIGLGIGIDYALFVVSRFREELARSDPQRARCDPQRSGESQQRNERERVAHAVGIALATSGRTILFSGVIVALSLAALLVVNSGLIQEIAIGTIVVVTCMLAAAMTLLPAVLAMLGPRINRGALPLRLRPASIQPGAGRQGRAGAARWALLIMRHPIPAMSATVAVLVLAAIPAFHLHLGFSLGIFQNTTTPSGQGEKALARALTPGAVGAIQIVLTSRGDSQHLSSKAEAAAKSLSQQLELDSRVTGIGERRSPAGVLLGVVASVPVDSAGATALVERIRKRLAPPIEAHGGPIVLVGGTTAQTIDVTNELRSKYLLILALILVPSLLFLLVAFRSLVLPVKAVLMNLLATSATMGLVVLVFQDGHGQHLLGFTSTGFIQTGVPLIMFALLFGLSMDYEVFLIRRMQEEWKKTGDNTLAVASGMEYTARSITAAAAIMVAVFGSFMTVDLLELKQLGFALALAIALDATLIRLVLVPAVMRLLGARNWWLPAWLARVLPNLGVD